MHGGVAAGMLRVPVRGPVEGEHARQPGRRFAGSLEGCEAGYAGLGFDDLLDNVGAGDAARRAAAQALAAPAALDAIGEPDLTRRCRPNRAAVQALRDAVGAITTTIKTELLHGARASSESVIPTDNDS